MLADFINRDAAVKKLIKQRCKLADSRTKFDQRNSFIVFERTSDRKTTDGLYKMFPPRSKWCHIGRFRKEMDSISRNEQRLLHTYLKAKESKCSEEWYLNLCHYADSIVSMASPKLKEIKTPKVFALEKERKGEDLLCRPICKFPLKEGIFLSLLNKYLTEVFDDQFYSCSYAFRKAKDSEMQHQKAVKAIVDYRKTHRGETLYVAECDMKKFYDSISHEVIKRRFNTLLRRAIRKGKMSKGETKLIRHLFFLYVDCFNFKKHVYDLNNKPGNPIWEKLQNPEGLTPKIGWVSKDEEELKNAGLLDAGNPVGVPQGGALSGLIANIVMHFVDEKLIKRIGKKDILYCRFCDDMILIGAKKKQIEQVFELYQSEIIHSRLFAHAPQEVTTFEHMRDFWNGKSRAPYAWNKEGESVFPWITFVGFDINWDGQLRIRKKSYDKHKKKQYDVANEILSLIEKKKPRYCAGTIRESIKNRLIAMSVGRVKIWNYKTFKNQRSWMKAFSILDENPWSRRQLKQLDRNRQSIIRQAAKRLSAIDCPPVSKEGRSDSAFILKGFPFSYYAQCFCKAEVHK